MRRFNHLLAACAVVIVAIAFAPGRANAQIDPIALQQKMIRESTSLHMNDQELAFAIQPDGSVDVTEVLHVDFVNESNRHGIFRTIQVRFDYNPEPKYERVYKISNVHVDAEGASGKNAISEVGRMKQFKIGDGDKTVTGPVTYTITYKLRGALNGFDDHDEFYWNAVGFDWLMPIGATATKSVRTS